MNNFFETPGTPVQRWKSKLSTTKSGNYAFRKMDDTCRQNAACGPTLSHARSLDGVDRGNILVGGTRTFSQFRCHKPRVREPLVQSRIGPKPIRNLFVVILGADHLA